MLEKALILAAKAHTGQVDKGGAPYILHPIRVMLACEEEKEKIVALLHDTLEDTALTAADLRRAGFPEEIVQAVCCLNSAGRRRITWIILRASAKMRWRRE